MCPTRVSGSPCGREPRAREPVDEDDGVCLIPIKCGGRGGCPSACLRPPPAMGGGRPAMIDQQGQSCPGAPLREAASHRPVPRRAHAHTHVHTLALACMRPCPSWWSAPPPLPTPPHDLPLQCPPAVMGAAPEAAPGGPAAGTRLDMASLPWFPFCTRQKAPDGHVGRLAVPPAGRAQTPASVHTGRPRASLGAHLPAPGPPGPLSSASFLGSGQGASTTSQLCLLHLQGGASQGRPRREVWGLGGRGRVPQHPASRHWDQPPGAFPAPGAGATDTEAEKQQVLGPRGETGRGGHAGQEIWGGGNAPFPASQKVTCEGKMEKKCEPRVRQTLKLPQGHLRLGQMEKTPCSRRKQSRKAISLQVSEFITLT